MKIVIYGSEEGKCSYCDAAKMFCEMENLPFTYRVVDKEKLQELFGEGTRTIPQIVVNSKHVGGYREFREYAKLFLK